MRTPEELGNLALKYHRDTYLNPHNAYEVVLTDDELLFWVKKHRSFFFFPGFWDINEKNRNLLQKYVNEGLLITADKVKNHPETMNPSYLYLMAEDYSSRVF